MLNPDEIAAVERLRRHTGGDTSVYEHWQDEDGPYLNPRGCISLMEDEEKLARLALRLLAADDETPVDEAWLRSVGFATCDNPDDGIFTGNSELCLIYDGCWFLKRDQDCDCDVMLPRPLLETRGDVRCLCQALGIELNERKDRP